MPRLSAFYGIVIYMYFLEDHGTAHFHVEYNGQWASFAVVDGQRLAGAVPARAQRMVRAWAELHRDELHDAWERARSGNPPGTIRPLP